MQQPYSVITIPTPRESPVLFVKTSPRELSSCWVNARFFVDKFRTHFKFEHRNDVWDKEAFSFGSLFRGGGGIHNPFQYYPKKLRRTWGTKDL